MMHRIGLLLCSFVLLICSEPFSASAEDTYADRTIMFQQMSAVTGIPWYYLAAIDQYERAMSRTHPDRLPKGEGPLSIHFNEQEWAGVFNPDYNDTLPASIQFFNGIGRDGNADGIADRNNAWDVLYTISSIILQAGTSPNDFRIGLWEFYQNPRSVDRIMQFARIYEHFGRLNLTEVSFPLPLRANYTYRSTWGARRGWGGARIHEGTDIFAAHGVPVRSTCYGIIEVKGWNRYGGWRIGIRDLSNNYHYYAHLTGFNRDIDIGEIVAPGQVIGWVGSSGYGKPGTQGKFPPHLHYGIYRDRGFVDWAFDPYPYLGRCEREERARLRSRR